MLARLRALDPLRADLLLAGLFFVEALLEVLFLVPDGHRRQVAAVVLLVAALAVALAIRRRLPALRRCSP